MCQNKLLSLSLSLSSVVVGKLQVRCLHFSTRHSSTFIYCTVLFALLKNNDVYTCRLFYCNLFHLTLV